ncbi:AraC family transcriptional regulator [Paenibacillus sp. CF384]|uniref:AraC family transcriptional regulator n=1 Tax=Paenibacillus sp. CF384 TaxID=1884382 RepID=UPI000894C505|nr:helix-turn-helix domain-containing protein [Paenibacillus sp. CF384]SDW47170.1 Cache domain-containing protein [Paenibacillus sp. CF384]
MYKKLLLTFVVCMTALILILSSVLFYSYKSSSISLIKDMNVNVLSKISYSSVYMDNMARKFCQSLSLNNYIIAFANSNELDIITTGNAIRTLDSLTLPNTYIHSAYIYNKKIDTFISSPPSTFFSSSDFPDKEIKQLLEDAQKRKNFTPILYPIPRKIDNYNVYTYILFDTSDYNGNSTNAIVLNVDADWLRLTISSLDQKKNSSGSSGDILILDENGTIVSHPTKSMFMNNVSGEPYASKVLTTADGSGTFFNVLNGKKYVVSYVSSDILKWKFVSLTPYSSVFSSVQWNGWLTLLFCVIVLVLGLFIAVIASKKLYHPFAVLMDKTTLLERQKRDSAAVLKNEFMKQMLSASAMLPIEKVMAKEQEHHFDISFTHSLFLFILKIDDYHEFVNKHNEKDRVLLKYSIENITKEIVSAHYKCEIINHDSDHFTVLVDMQHLEVNQEQLNDDIFRALVTDIQLNIQRFLPFTVSVTLGYVIESYEQLKLIYEETLNLSMYRLKVGHQSIITPEILKQIDDGANLFPSSKEKQLLDALRLGNGESAKETYRELMRAIEHSSYDNIIRSILYLSFSIYNSLNRVEDGTSSRINSFTLEFLNKIPTFETLQLIEQRFSALIDEIVQLKDGNKDKKKNEIVESAVELIQSNYSDKNLSLGSCAEHLSISSVYLGKLFKSATGNSVAEYITMIRMEKIGGYLETTNLPINDILERCGIEKSNYFYTTFKKYFGVSLTEYRLKNVNKPPSSI